MITTYQQMKSLLSGSGSGTYYLDNVPFAADAEAVDVNGKKNILGSVDVNGAGTRVVAKGIAAKADPSETSESIVIFRIADSAEVSFSDFTANVKASVAENVEIISVDAGKLLRCFLGLIRSLHGLMSPTRGLSQLTKGLQGIFLLAYGVWLPVGFLRQ